MRPFTIKYELSGRVFTWNTLAGNWVDCGLQFRRQLGWTPKIININDESNVESSKSTLYVEV